MRRQGHGRSCPSSTECCWLRPPHRNRAARALWGALASLQGRRSAFPATLPRAQFGFEEREQAGSPGHHHTRLVSLPRAAPAWQASAPRAITAHLAPTNLPEPPDTHRLYRGCVYTGHFLKTELFCLIRINKHRKSNKMKRQTV